MAEITFLDTETTGLPDRAPWLEHPEFGPEITEIAIATWRDGQTSDVERIYVKPRNLHLLPPPEDDVYWTHPDERGKRFPLSYNAVQWAKCGAVPWNLDHCKRMRARLDGQILAGSNPAFDMDRIAWEHDRRQEPRPQWQHRKVDTNGLGIWLWLTDAIQSTSLVNLAAHFEIEHEAHTARGDVLASIAVFEKLFDLAVYQPGLWRDALAEIVECSPDPGMGEFAAKALAGEDWR